MKSIGGIILVLFFLLELGAIVAFGYWGYHVEGGTAIKVLLAIVAPLAVAIAWGMFLSPKASVPIFSFPARTALKLVVFIGASEALYAVGQSSLGAAFLAVSIVIVATVFLLKLHEVKM
ncbi:YrdB family protein [Cohnella soli]|uniref:YrdB family protein n=1 Tax=Cohnella soli TaxID=425005 RepID=A0ABW0HRW9_9BACL